MPFPQTLDAKPKIIFFTDFDGTITLQDTNDFITDNYGYGKEARNKVYPLILDEKLSFREGFQQMIDSWKVSLNEMVDILCRNIKLDPHFREFAVWANENRVPIIVLSGGMVPVIDALLKQQLGDLAKDIEVIANDAQKVAPGYDLGRRDGWNIKYHDDSGFGHDKSLTIRPYAEAIAKMEVNDRPTLLYAGDGVSDLSAAAETDLLFAKEGHDLIVYCERRGIPFTTFQNWSNILKETREIYEGKKSVQNVATEGLQRHRTNSSSRPAQKSGAYNRKMSLSQMD